MTATPHGHWLTFDKDRQIVGCHCGFRADLDSDCGWGDSVVNHLLATGWDTAYFADTERRTYADNPYEQEQ